MEKLKELTESEIKDYLIVIAKKLARIEDRNPDWYFSKRWNYLRNKQDELYSELKERKCLSNQQSKNNTLIKSRRSLEAKKGQELLRLCQSAKSVKTDSSMQI